MSIPKDTRGRPQKIKWAKLPVGTGHPASSGTAHYQNRMSGGRRHYVYRTIDGRGYVFRAR